MRNLKKFLAVALALAMTLSLMVTASAAFTDADKIDSTYAESVEVLSGLGVFKGYNDGSFNPQGDITRAEVAAIIYRITTGDVEDKQAALYAGAAKFADVPATEWYAGYVGFCANAGYVNGYEDGTFRPTGKVTGFEALAMVLRAIGYDAQNEFSGSKWQDNIAWVANNRGITADVKPGVLVNAASRELVAEILFETLLVDTVYYMPSTGYRTADTSLGEKIFELHKFEGVVTANEWADLYGDEPLAAGKTIINGVKYNVSTDIQALGEAREGYAAGKDVLVIADAGNKVFATGEGTTITKSNVGMKLDGAEWFVNFDGGYATYESDYRIEYVIEFDKTKLTEKADEALKEALAANGGEFDKATYTYTKAIKAGADITALDMDHMETIFVGADYQNADFVTGEVYVGTKSVAGKDDISDEISWKKFKAEYITVGEGFDKFNSENGEWLKVVDNDEDGYADYVLLTEFAMSKIVDITKKDVYTFADLTAKDVAIELTKVDGEDIVTEATLAEGDVVVYTVIDGVYYVDLAEVETVTVDKKGVDYRNATITADGVKYEQSGIYFAELGMYEDLTDAESQETYELYLDTFGYVRMFQEPGYGNGFVLLTDGYFKTDNRTDDYKAEIFDLESAALKDVEIVDGKAASYKNADRFIDDTEGDNGNRGTWKRLFKVDEVYNFANEGQYKTNIAGFTTSDDGYTLIYIEGEDAISNREVYDVQEIAVDKNTDLDDKTLNGNIQTTTETVYYLVLKNSYNNISEITTWTGYANAPETAALGAVEKTFAYAVTVGGEVAGRYDVAQVVVFETVAANPYDMYFVYDYAGKAEDPHTAITIGYDSADEAYESDFAVSVDTKNSKGELYLDALEMIEFTNIALDGTVDVITSDYADEYIYAGYAYTAADVNDRDYLKVIDAVGDTWYFKPASVPSYTVKEDKYGVYTVSEQVEDFEANDDLIFVTNSKGAIQYVINVEQSFAYNTATSKYDIAVDALVELYARIWADAQPKAVTTYTVNGVGEYLLGDKVIVETLEGEYALVESDATGAADKYALIGAQDTIEIEVTGNMVVTDGLYDVVIDGETYYTTLASDANGDGKWNAAELAAIAKVTETGSYYKWVYNNGSEAMLSAGNAGAYLDLVNYAVNKITFGYVSVTGVEGYDYVLIGTKISYTNKNVDGYAEDLAIVGADIATARVNNGATLTFVAKADVKVTVTPFN